MQTTAVTVTPVLPDTTEIEKETAGIVALARTIVVDSDGTRTSAAAFLGKIRTRRDRIKAFFDPLIEGAKETKAAAEAHRKKVVAAYEEVDRPGIEAEKIVKNRIGRYEDQQYTLRVEALRKQVAAARERERAVAQAAELEAKAEADRQRAAQAEAEAARLEDEGDAEAAREAETQADAARRIAEENAEAAKAAQADAANAPIPIGPRPPPKSAPGAVTSRHWTFKVVDFSKVPDKWKILNQAELGRHIRKSGEAAVATIPGIAVFSEANVAAKAI